MPFTSPPVQKVSPAPLISTVRTPLSVALDVIIRRREGVFCPTAHCEPLSD
jgi:hypothetical protein